MLVMALDDAATCAARIGFCKFTVVCGSAGRPDSVLGIHVKGWGVGGLGIDVGNVATCRLDISAAGTRPDSMLGIRVVRVEAVAATCRLYISAAGGDSQSDSVSAGGGRPDSIVAMSTFDILGVRAAAGALVGTKVGTGEAKAGLRIPLPLPLPLPLSLPSSP